MSYQKLVDINDVLLEEIGRQCPQIMMVKDIGIEDVRKYGYEFAFGNDKTQEVIINGKKYIVKEDPLSEYLQLIELYCCKCLSPGNENIDKIYQCFCKIIDNPTLFQKAMKRSEFEFAYHNNRDGKKLFVAMDIKNSTVATILFSLYH